MGYRPPRTPGSWVNRRMKNTAQVQLASRLRAHVDGAGALAHALVARRLVGYEHVRANTRRNRNLRAHEEAAGDSTVESYDCIFWKF